MFCATGLVFGSTEGVGSRLHVMRARTHFRRYRGRRVPFLFFTRPDSFLAVPEALGLVFMLCEAGLVFDGTDGVGSYFQALRSRTHFRPYRGRRVTFSFLCARTQFRWYRGRQVSFSCFAR
jgi:hypothetical protein